jgi:hypothetical protein
VNVAHPSSGRGVWYRSYESQHGSVTVKYVHRKWRICWFLRVWREAPLDSPLRMTTVKVRCIHISRACKTCYLTPRDSSNQARAQDERQKGKGKNGNLQFTSTIES